MGDFLKITRIEEKYDDRDGIQRHEAEREGLGETGYNDLWVTRRQVSDRTRKVIDEADACKFQPAITELGLMLDQLFKAQPNDSVTIFTADNERGAPVPHNTEFQISRCQFMVPSTIPGSTNYFYRIKGFGGPTLVCIVKNGQIVLQDHEAYDLHPSKYEAAVRILKQAIAVMEGRVKGLQDLAGADQQKVFVPCKRENAGQARIKIASEAEARAYYAHHAAGWVTTGYMPKLVGTLIVVTDGLTKISGPDYTPANFFPELEGWVFGKEV